MESNTKNTRSLPASGTAAIVVTFNRKKLLSECIEALRDQSAGCDILVIDNHSTDGTGEYVRGLSEAAFPASRLLYYNTGENLGGAGGFAYGLEKAYALGYEFFWLMDDDCIPKPDALEQLLRFGRQQADGFGFLASRILFADGTLCRINMPRRGMFRKRYFPEKEAYRCDLACFTSVLFPREAVRTVGLPFREFFIWSDDWEYTRRISRRFPCYAVMGSTAVHKPATRQSLGIVTERSERITRYQYVYRNDVCLYRREGFPGILYVFFRGLAHTLRVLCARGPDTWRERLAKCRIIWSATRKGFSFRPAIRFAKETEQ